MNKLSIKNLLAKINKETFVNEIVKRIIFYLLIISLIVNGYFILKTYYLKDIMSINKIPDVKFIEKKETIKVKGKVKTKTKDKPYAIVIDKINDEYEINFNKSTLPDNLTVDSIEQDSSFIWYKPFRIGVEFVWDKKITYNPTVLYNPLQIGNIEFGIGTNFKSIGVDIGYNILDSNIVGNATYYLDNTISVGISIKVW